MSSSRKARPTLCCGLPHKYGDVAVPKHPSSTQRVTSMSIPELTDDQQMIRQTVRALAEKHFRPKAAEIDRARRPPIENIKLLAEHGFTGLFVSQEYGGPGLGLMEIVLVIEELARCCANTALLAGSTEGAAPRAHFLSWQRGAAGESSRPRLRAESFSAGGACRNPTPDQTSARCRPKRSSPETNISSSGSKLWCTAAQVAEIFVVFARLSDEPGLKGIGALLVPRDAPGLHYRQAH